MKRWTRLGVVAVLAGALVAVPASPIAAADKPRDEWWSTRVSRVAKKVEALRGLKFREPVPVDFVSERAFRREYVKLVEGEGRTIGPKVMAGTKVMLEALGLLEKKESIPGTARESAPAQLLAYYDPFSRRVLVRGRDLGPATEVLLAHELTHALQDQHFGLKRLLDVRGFDGDSARRALMEGDAQRIAEKYVAKMPRNRAREALVADISADDVPGADAGAWAGFAVTGGPYVLGQELVAALRTRYGNVDRAFRRPPDHQVQVLNPVTASEPTRTFNVTTPKLERGERAVGTVGTVGAITLYAALAQHLDPLVALQAADEWRASVGVAFRHEGRSCVRIGLRADNIHGRARLVAALQQWAVARPPGSAGVTDIEEITFVLESCSRPTQPAPIERLGQTVSIAVLRNHFVNVFMDEDLGDARTTKCVVDGLLADPEYRKLLADATVGEEADEATNNRFGERAGVLGAGCEFSPYDPDVLANLPS